MAARAGTALAVAVPALLTVWLAFSSGGFFAGAAATAAVVLAGALAVQTAVAARPFAGLGAAAVVPALGLLGLAGWALLSATWSDATGRAVVEHARPLAYALALLLLAGPAFSSVRLRWAVRASAAALTGVALCGLVTRVLPEVWSVAPSLQPGRLAYPVSYWNGMGLLAACAALLCLHLACEGRERVAVRAVAAAVVPALTVTVLLTFSRAALAAGVVGLVVYLLAARPRGAGLALLATVPTSAGALVVAYGADALGSRTPQSAAAVAEGRDVAVAVLVAGLLAAAPFVLTAARTGRRARYGAPPRPRAGLALWPPFRGAGSAPGGRAASSQGRAAPRPGAAPIRRRAAWGLGAGVAALSVVLAVAVGAPGAVAGQADDFLAGDSVPERADARTRLTEAGNNGRLDHWEVALDAFADAPLHGRGAGTYQLEWNRRSGRVDAVVDAHSLYLEALGELGVVGLALVLVAVLGVLLGLLARVRARDADRPAVAAVLAVAVVWALCAGVDWDWELPAVTLWLFALAGAALAARRPAEDAPAPGAWSGRALAARAVVVAGCALVAALPLALARSQAALDGAVDALRAGDAPAAARHAADAIDRLPARAEPWEALGYAELLAGRPAPAADALRAAARRDPQSWEPRYGLALARAAAADPRARATARRAVALAPTRRVAQELLWSLDAPRRDWPQAAAKAPLLIPPTPDDAARAALGGGGGGGAGGAAPAAR